MINEIILDSVLSTKKVNTDLYISYPSTIYFSRSDDTMSMVYILHKHKGMDEPHHSFINHPDDWCPIIVAKHTATPTRRATLCMFSEKTFSSPVYNSKKMFFKTQISSQLM